ncbi:putative bifunctional diguanylate cyclase/phosphodiesterase [Pseudomonas benzenivorans]|uniref:EAL domain-containing protein n=1 Tax=Pseudomonas benzenivorans TaxID=556533 RepID=A0ABY5HCE2_9PSED|nr:EAL domain-containing protein [Pseudomonas benzenivorans]UTW09004.1 EAL domain-containing protein [Pseudomonas benzenivorans]
MSSDPARSKARPKTRRRLREWRGHSITAGFVLLWLIGSLAIYRDARQMIVDTEAKIRKEMSLETRAMAQTLAGMLERTYLTIRTVSLLPAVRAAVPHNRANTDEDVVEQGYFSDRDTTIIQQLYNHIAADIDVSEIYLVYDGFDPEQGQVPFLMFDEVLLERIGLAKEAEPTHDADEPEEYEAAEYMEYVQQLDHLRRHAPLLPVEAPNGIAAVTSALLRTCDNSQYTSLANGDERDSHGLLLSVPVYDLSSKQFKGLVTAVLRANVLEAALLGWPRLPITELDKRLLAQRHTDLSTAPAEYVLENRETGDRIMDRRSASLPRFLGGLEQPAIHLEQTLELPYSSAWHLHRYKSTAHLDSAIAPIQRDMWQRLGLLSLLLAGLGLAVERVFAVQRKSTRTLTRMANYDALTGLPNRRLVAEHLSHALDRQQPGNSQYGVLMIDLDDFKEVNDTLGHQIGDRLLIEVSQRFVHSLRTSDQLFQLHNEAAPADEHSAMVGRLGGDEFLVLLPNQPGLEQILGIAERLQASLLEPIDLGQDQVYVHASIGIAVHPEHGSDGPLLLRSADTAMYLAKRQGRGQTVVFQQDLDEKSRQRLQLLTDLHSALTQKQFVLHYQPELNLASGRIDCVEALIRWQHPTLGLIYPADFITLLEQSALILEVGQWVLETACRQLKAWQDAGSGIEHMCVNVSLRQLTQPGFAETLQSTIRRAGISPGNLSLELTESMLMQHPEANIRLLHELRKTGVKIALDDFGTGYSSFSYLRQLPLDVLKIDRSFVIDTATEQGQAICQTLAALAQRLGLKVIAEGVETTEQFFNMSEVGSDWMQGYLISRPLAAERTEQLARSFDWQAFKTDNGLHGHSPDWAPRHPSSATQPS